MLMKGTFLCDYEKDTKKKKKKEQNMEHIECLQLKKRVSTAAIEKPLKSFSPKLI